MPADLRVPAVVGVWAVVVLGLDAVAPLGGQRLLGLVTWLLLAVLLRAESRETRFQVAVVVAFATVVEYVFAGWLGVYVYRLDNVPAFVPPGHGLVYLAAVALGRSAWARRHERAFVGTTLAGCTGWALWGVTLSDRPDVLGLFWCACLLVFALRGRSPLTYAGAFVVVSALELYGTGIGTWTWQPVDPTGLVSIGNPPSGVAGGYAWFDAAALAAAPWLQRRWDARRAAPPLAGPDPVSAPEPARPAVAA